MPVLKQAKCSRSVWICVRRGSTKGKAELIRSCWLLISCSVSKDGTAIQCRWHACSKEPCTISAFSRYWWSKEVVLCDRKTARNGPGVKGTPRKISWVLGALPTKCNDNTFHHKFCRCYRVSLITTYLNQLLTVMTNPASRQTVVKHWSALKEKTITRWLV